MVKIKKEKPHYVKNTEFSEAVVKYVKEVKAAEAAGESLPIVTDYIADCFLRIAEGLSHKSNFIRYTYREEMVMDAVENCLKAITNYNIDAPTRTGKPNAFAYFTQISWWAFLRRIAKEKRQQDIKMRYISQAGLDTAAMATYDASDPGQSAVILGFVDELKGRIDKVKEYDTIFTEYAKAEKVAAKKPKVQGLDSDLEDFM